MTTFSSPESSAHSLADRIAASPDPNRLAVISPAGSISYRQLLDRAERLTVCLGPAPGPVLVYGHKEPAMVVAFVAALQSERPYVPADRILPPRRVERMLELAQPAAVVAVRPVPASLVAAIERRGIPMILCDPLAEEVDDLPPREAGNPPGPDGDRPAYIMFTSGTTGDPKGVPVPCRGLAHFADWLLATHDFRPGEETFLNQAPFNFDLSVMDLYGALLTGGSLFSISRDEIADLRRLFGRLYGASLTTWVSTPSFVQLCLAEPRFGQSMLPSLRRFVFCGETLAPRTARALLDRFRGVEVWNTYGPTEATVAVTAVRISAELAISERPLPVGWPAPGTEVWVATPADALRRMPAGCEGEIVIAGPQVALGYLLSATPAELADGGRFFSLPDGRRAYRTGDLGHVDPETGLLYCHGRLDRQVKVHGYRLELEEIETWLRAIPGVADATVIPVCRGAVTDHLAAFVVPAVDAERYSLPTDRVGLGQLVREFLSAHLPAYALPRQVHLLVDPPLTPNGKLDRQSLQDRLG